MSEAAKRAAELANDARPIDELDPYSAKDFVTTPDSLGVYIAFTKYIQHVSNVAKELNEECPEHIPVFLLEWIRALILPEPTDPVVDAIKDAFGRESGLGEADDLRAALKARGLQITPIGDGV